jgi:hypothetical protein
MLEINFKIKPNDFFTTNPKSVLTSILNRYNTSLTPYGYIFLGYPNWHQPDIDLFQYFENEFLDNLRQRKTVLIVDYTYEGFSCIECPIIKILESNCEKYNIDPKKIFYFTGNLKDKSNLINVIPIFLLDHNDNFKILETDLEEIQNRCFAATEDKVFLSLSRRNRMHRVLAHAMLANNPLKEHAIISQDILTNVNVDDRTLEKIGYNKKEWKRFSKTLPLIADKNEFHINDPFNVLPDLHYKTSFSIVNETLIHDYNDTSLFFSEKILKPIINFQPMIIYGQPGINHALKNLGYELYNDYFDLSFDFEKDHILRYKKLLQSIEPVVKKLSMLSAKEKIAWRFKHEEILLKNFNNFLQQTHSNNAGKIFADCVSKL